MRGCPILSRLLRKGGIFGSSGATFRLPLGGMGICTSLPLICHHEAVFWPRDLLFVRCALAAARWPSAVRKEIYASPSDSRQLATDNCSVEAARLHWPLKNSAQRGFEGAQLQLRRSKSFHTCHPEEAFRPTRDLFLAFFSRLFSRAIHALLRIRARLPVVPLPLHPSLCHPERSEGPALSRASPIGCAQAFGREEGGGPHFPSVGKCGS